MSGEAILFWVFAAGAVGSAVLVLLGKNPVACAMSLVGTFFFLAGVYVLLWAHTIAVLQVMVYAGAIMVLFLFVIMLLSLTEVGPSTRLTASRALGALSVVGLLGALVAAFSKLPTSNPSWVVDQGRVNAFGTLQSIGQQIFTGHVLPFEALSLLLLVAIVGAVVVAKSRI